MFQLEHTMNKNNTQIYEKTMSKIVLKMPLKCTNHFKKVFGHLWLSFYVVNAVQMRKMWVKYKYAGPAVWA